MPRRLAHPLRIIAAGVALTALGIYFNFQLERHSFDSTGDFRFIFLEYASLPTLGLGLLGSLVGAAIWAWGVSSLRAVGSGIATIALAFVAGALTPINIHGWSGCLMFVYVAAVLAGVLVIVIGLARKKTT